MDWNDFSFINLEASATPQVYERGMEYLRQGHLLQACKTTNILAGVLTGTGGEYKVRLWINQSGLQGDCSCPYSGFCKHMVALAAAWLEDKARFSDLQSKITTILENPASQTDFLLRLIDKDPLNFLALFPEETTQLNFINARGVLNLIRNTFSMPRITPADAEALWEKVKHIGGLIVDKFRSGDPQAPELLMELISGLEKTAEDCHNESLNKFFIEFIYSLHSAASQNPGMIRPLIEKLLAVYLNPNLWELNVELKSALLELYKYDSDFLYLQVDERLSNEPALLVLIPLYGLLTDIVPDNQRFLEPLCKVTEKLNALPDGCLWLVDRLIESDIDQAYKMAREGSRIFAGAKRSFRERLILIHQKRNELKQAAALSFIQFQEEPNFEEYLRLKNILSRHPADWHSYLNKIMELLTSSGEELLAVRIMIAERDYQGIINYLDRIIADDALLMAASQIFVSEIPTGATEIYPVLIKTLLERRTPSYWKAALQLLITFKRYCYYDVAKKEEWVLLRDELHRAYQDDTGFAKKFGGILAGGG